MRYYLFFLAFFLAAKVNAQSLTDSIGNPGFVLEDTISDKLAELAINNYMIKADDAEIKSMNHEIKKSKASWFNSLNASFNLNEANIKAPAADQQNVFFPRYNFSMTLPLGSFFTKASDVKIAKARHEKAIAMKNADVENLKKLIKMEYQLYQSNKYLLALHELVLQDERVLLSVAEAKFKKNEVGLEVLTLASKKYNHELHSWQLV